MLTPQNYGEALVSVLQESKKRGSEADINKPVSLLMGFRGTLVW